jgi:MarR family transcriptional regulator, lower aerobic nicotinate degradation pathway regulator
MPKDKQFNQSTQSILDSIRYIVKALRVSSRLAEKSLGISGAQLYVLQKLSEDSHLSINELAERTRTHQSSVSVVVGRLIQRELVLRSISKNDARQVELSLTSKGRRVVQNAPSMAQEQLISAVESLSVKRRKALKDLLSAVVVQSGFAGHLPQLFFEDEKEWSP